MDQLKPNGEDKLTPEQEDARAKLAQQSDANASEALKTPEERAREAIRCEVNITLFKDGNFQVNGPFEDRILFEGVMALALDAVHDKFKELAFLKAQQQAQESSSRIARASYYERKQIEKLKKGG